MHHQITVTMMKRTAIFLMMSIASLAYSQDTDTAKQTIKPTETEDLAYELAHKSQAWFTGMQDGAAYFSIKNKFDTYFGQHRWEKSKPRALGESWLKTKIFYLDKNGIVQPEPVIMRPINSLVNQAIVESSTSAGSWGLLGPVNSANTNYSSGGNHGGYVYLNRIDPTNTQKMFVAFVTGGLWMTVDGGTNWTLTDANFPDVTYSDIDVCMANPQVVYALSLKQLLKSTDGGLNWQTTTLTDATYAGKAYDIAVSPTDPNVVIARWGGSLYRTTDGGTTWTSIKSGLPEFSIWDCSIHSEMLDWSTTDNNVVYLLSTSGNNMVQVYHSPNSGSSFELITTITLDATAIGQAVGWAKLLLPTSNASSIYVAVGSGDNPYGHHSVHLYKLNNTTGVQELARVNMIASSNSRNLHHGDFTMDRTNENKIVYGTYGEYFIHFSTNNGASFTQSAENMHYDIRSIDVVNDTVLVGTDGESVVSLDGGNTNTTVTNSISNHELWGFGSAFKSDLVASGNNHGPVMIKESSNGFNWYNGTGADQGNTDVNPLDDRYIYSQGYSNYRYFRTGVHTLINEPNFLDLGGIYSYFNSIEFHPNKYYSMITHHAGGYPSGNANLETWKKSLIKTEDNGNSILIIKTFESQVFREKISMKNPDYMVVVEGLTNNTLWLTKDAGASWVNITPSSAASSGQTNISDIAIGDENANEIWVTYSGVQTACKILKSNDYGANWTNLTQVNLTASPITKIVFQRGSNGGVYIGNKSGIYYRNNAMANWQLLGTGLPMADIRFMFINYNHGKIKIGTSRGAFEHELYETSPPNALISASSDKVLCPMVEKIQFKDYSVVRNASATWAWSFPGGEPALSIEENPLVSYANTADGTYDVTLTVTDAFGTSSQTLTNFIQVSNQCGTSIPDKVPGNMAKLTGAANNDYLEVNDLNITKNSFTFSCWIKPQGIQPGYSAIFMSQEEIGSFGLNFLPGSNIIGFHPSWSWSSGLIAPADEWSHVAMVSNGSNVKIYVNGIEKTHGTALPNDVVNKTYLGIYGRGWSNRSTTMEMDEVCIWNRPLTKDEIRKWRHLTKPVDGDPVLTGLVAYYQFNETVGALSVNKTAHSNYAAYKGTSGSTHSVSSVPVFGGVSEKVNVSSTGVKSFSTTGISITFTNGTLPFGDIWISRGDINPDPLPDAATSFGTYAIINNYGTNKTFTKLSSISFTGNSLFTYSDAASYRLYQRASNAFGNTWGSAMGRGDQIAGVGENAVITFSNNINITSLGQFVLSGATVVGIDQDLKQPTPDIFPNPIKNSEPLKINLPKGWPKSTMIIYNNMGSKKCQISLKKGSNEVLLNIASGLYHGLIFNQKERFNYNIIIE